MSKSAENNQAVKTDNTAAADENIKKESKPKKNSGSKANAELVKITEELSQTKDLLLRTAAEFDNYKKRTQREAERIGSDSRASVVKQLLPIVDNLERAADNTGADIEDYKKGIDMTTKQFFDILKKLGLEEIEAEGKTFDPNFHYAVSQIEKEDAEPGSVAQVLQKGYKMGETVLRPAMVAVVKAD